MVHLSCSCSACCRFGDRSELLLKSSLESSLELAIFTLGVNISSLVSTPSLSGKGGWFSSLLLLLLSFSSVVV